MRNRVIVAALAVTMFVLPATAATIGEIRGLGSSFITSNATFVNLARPALADGTIDIAQYIWSGAPAAGCVNAITIKFFRRGTTNDPALDVIATRGPFNAKTGVNTVALSPAVSILKGDWIGFTRSAASDCGGVLLTETEDSELEGTALVTGAAKQDVILARGRSMNLLGRTGSEYLYGVIPVVGSVAGNQGSQFRTSAQLSNRSPDAARGRLVFHPAGKSASPGDPELPFSLSANESVSFADVIASAGASGLGTLDMIMYSGAPPDLSVRVFNDGGAKGTSGLTEHLITPGKALGEGERATLTVPADLANYRLNAGVRTFGEETQMQVEAWDADGTKVAFTSHTYPANYFSQFAAADLIGHALPAGGYIRVWIVKGRAVVYGATTDNRTNDPSIAFATR